MLPLTTYSFLSRIRIYRSRLVCVLEKKSLWLKETTENDSANANTFHWDLVNDQYFLDFLELFEKSLDKLTGTSEVHCERVYH